METVLLVESQLAGRTDLNCSWSIQSKQLTIFVDMVLV